MRTELVNTLLKAGIVNEEAVLQAIEHPMGTSLVERLLVLGYGSEDDVYKIIKNKLKLEVVRPEDLANIDPRVFKVVPKGLIERHHFLPFYSDSTNIHIAVIDPTQDSCLNEICFFTHLRVIPYGVLASDLTKALNRYFSLGLPEEFKHKKVFKQEGEMPKDMPLPPPPPNFPLPKRPPAPEGLPPLPEIKAAEKEKQEEIKVVEQQVEIVEQEEVKVPESKSVSSDDIGVFDIGEDGDFRDISSTDIQVDPLYVRPEEETKVSELQEEVKATKELDLSPIATADNKDAILDAVSNALRSIAPRALILFVKEDDMVAVRGFGEHIDDNLDDYKISLSAPNMFQWVFQNKAEFSGSPQSGYLNDMFFKRFGGFVPESMAIVPAVIEGEVFAVIYCESPSSIDDMKRTASAMAEAFDKLLNSI